jgi:hypothetical protein
VIPQQVRNYIAAGDLEGHKQGKGVNERWLVSICSVKTLRQKWHAEGKLPAQHYDVVVDATDVGQGIGGNVALGT